jgi:hypothetical protein
MFLWLITSTLNQALAAKDHFNGISEVEALPGYGNFHRCFHALNSKATCDASVNSHL